MLVVYQLLQTDEDAEIINVENAAPRTCLPVHTYLPWMLPANA